MGAVLVSPLGRTPGAVSGVYFALKKKDILINKVITVGTRDREVMTADREYLRKIFQFEGVAYEPLYVKEEDMQAHPEMVRALRDRMKLAIQKACEGENDVYVAVTGGRSGMGALITLETQLYGVKELLHLQVDRELEFGGSVEMLQNTDLVSGADMVASPYLNPTQWGEDAWELIRLPFLDLQPIAKVFQAFDQRNQWPDFNHPLLALLLVNGAQKFTDIFPPQMSFEAVEKIFHLQAAYHEAKTDYQKQDIVADLVATMRESKYAEAEIEQMKLLVRTAGLPDLKSEPDGPITPPSRVHMLYVWFMAYRKELLDLTAISGFLIKVAEFARSL